MRAASAAFLALGLLVPSPARGQAASCDPPRFPGPDSLAGLGRFWQAERLAPRLPAPPLPVAFELGALHARIRAGLGRWAGVDSVLRRTTGADSLPGTVALGAAAAEHLGDWPGAARRYRRLIEDAATPGGIRARAVVRLAVALTRLGLADSASAAWRRAAQTLPEIADWMSYHRALVEHDTSLAFAPLVGARTPGARERGDLLVAERRLALGNLPGALEVFQRLGRPLDVARVEYALGRRRAARARADSILRADPRRPEALLAANFLAQRYDTLTVRELAATSRVYRFLRDLRTSEQRLLLALSRADSNVALWLELSSVRSERRDHAGALAAVDSAQRRARRRQTAAVGLARVAVFLAARRWPGADSVGAALSRAHPGDSSAAQALLLLAERDRSQAQTAAELRRYRELVRRFGETAAANTARFRLAMYLYSRGEADSSSAVFRQVIARDSAGRLGTAPRYWDARVRLERGDTTAITALRGFAAREATSYYGVRSRELLGDTMDFFAGAPAVPAPQPGSFPPARARERIRLLAELGLEAEARWEALGWLTDSSASVQLLTAAAAVAGTAGFAREAIRLGEEAAARAGAITRGAARGMFPVPYLGAIEGAAEGHCLDPLLLAALIRQESRFTPTAVSRAGARGIAQVLPSTGRELARRLGIRDFHPDLLFVPDFNLHLGGRYLADRFRVDSFPLHAAIASYNAGPQRIDRWRRWPEFPDRDLFVERIAIAETRGYVRNVYANYAWYRQTYPETRRNAPQPAAASPAGR